MRRAGTKIGERSFEQAQAAPAGRRMSMVRALDVLKTTRGSVRCVVAVVDQVRKVRNMLM